MFPLVANHTGLKYFIYIIKRRELNHCCCCWDFVNKHEYPECILLIMISNICTSNKELFRVYPKNQRSTWNDRKYGKKFPIWEKNVRIKWKMTEKRTFFGCNSGKANKHVWCQYTITFLSELNLIAVKSKVSTCFNRCKFCIHSKLKSLSISISC